MVVGVASPLVCPLIFLIWLILRLFETKAPIYRQKRIGVGGRVFHLLKFRTMVDNADEILRAWLADPSHEKTEFEKIYKLKNDPRVTFWGKILRRTSLDELPQVLNVVFGDMSLVGPRPIVGDEICRYGAFFEWVFQAKPGLTGLWQVSGRNDVSYRRRVRLDTVYLKRWSLWLDVVLLFRTFRAVISGRGAY